MDVRSIIRGLTPTFLLQFWRDRKKKQTRNQLEEQRKTGDVLTFDKMVQTLENMGVQQGDTVLVHASLSKMGFVDGGPKTIVDALLKVIGPNGNLLMPTSPNALLQLDYIRQIEYFDVNESPSKLGALTEYFRKLPNVKRSAHPTEPVCAFGPDAEYLTAGHLGELTPYTQQSPFYRVAEKGGKILYLGVTLANAGTSLHLLEDAVPFKYPVYYDQIFEVEIRLPDGTNQLVKTKVHNPEFSKKRRCDELIPRFLEKNVCHEFQFGKAHSYIFDARKMLDQMIEDYTQKGITMYTPNGEA